MSRPGLSHTLSWFKAFIAEFARSGRPSAQEDIAEVFGIGIPERDAILRHGVKVSLPHQRHVARIGGR